LTENGKQYCHRLWSEEGGDRVGKIIEVMKKTKTDGWSGQKPVRRLLRHKGSEEFFKDGGWTTDPEEARNFSNALEVAETCARFDLREVELTLRFDSRASDVFWTTIR
jgi:hypothetical protein